MTPIDDGFEKHETCVVFLLGYPGVGKRTVGSHLAELLDAVLVDNQLINIPLLTLFKWDGRSPIPTEIWERVEPIREAVLGTIEDLAPKSNSYVFTNVLEDDEEGAKHYDRIRSLAHRRGSLFLSVMVDCDVEEQVLRIDNPDRIARLKGSDPEGYRRHRQHTKLYQPPAEEVVQVDTTESRRPAKRRDDLRDACESRTSATGRVVEVRAVPVTSGGPLVADWGAARNVRFMETPHPVQNFVAELSDAVDKRSDGYVARGMEGLALRPATNRDREFLFELH